MRYQKAFFPAIGRRYEILDPARVLLAFGASLGQSVGVLSFPAALNRALWKGGGKGMQKDALSSKARCDSSSMMDV